MKTISFRFDIDGIGDIRLGVPKLLNLSRELNVKFSFYINMGKSFNLRFFLQNKGLKILNNFLKSEGLNKKGQEKLSLLKKHGFRGIIETIIRNPELGIYYKETLFKVLDEGHELGLHGGIDHAMWQYNLHNLNFEQIQSLLFPAYKNFLRLFGQPEGFCSPGFVYNKYVLELLDKFGFLYSGDMDGEIPFRPILNGKEYKHYQIPVNIKGNNKIPLIEQLLVMDMSNQEIRDVVLCEVERRDTAVLYGHPSVEGAGAGEILRDIILSAIDKGYRVVRLKELVS